MHIAKSNLTCHRKWAKKFKLNFYKFKIKVVIKFCNNLISPYYIIQRHL